MSNSGLHALCAKYRLFWRLVWQDVRATYAGTMLGMAWILVGPLLLLFLYSMIYAVIFRVRVPNFTIEEYIINVFSGLVPFLAFSQALGASTGSLQRGKGLLSNAVFPHDLVPLKPIGAAYIMLPVGLTFTLLGDLAFSKVTWTWLAVPIVAALQVLFSMGIGYFLSMVGLVVRDTQIVIQYIVIALLVVTPIAYTPDMIPKGLLPLLYANPVFYYIYSYQNLILLNELPPWHVSVIGTVLAFAAFFGGRWFYERTRGIIGDLL